MADRGRLPGPSAMQAEARDRWRRRILAVQGGYYFATGAWPILHLPSFVRMVNLPINPFQAHTVGAILLVVGGGLLDATRRDAAIPFATTLGIAVAGAVALVELVWLPRFDATSALWIDFTAQVLIILALVVFYPRAARGERATQARRR